MISQVFAGPVEAGRGVTILAPGGTGVVAADVPAHDTAAGRPLAGIFFTAYRDAEQVMYQFGINAAARLYPEPAKIGFPGTGVNPDIMRARCFCALSQ